MLKFTIFVALAMISVCYSEPIIGSWTEQNGASGREFDLAVWATQKLASLTNFDGELTMIQVTNLKKQIVAGVRYVFTVDVLAAPKQGQYHTKSCTIEVYQREWEKFQEIVGVPTCVDKEVSSRVGEWTESNGANGDEYNLAIWATQQLASLTNFAGDFTLLTLKNVKKQVVAGYRYVFTVDVLAAPKEGKYNGQTCTIEVYTRPWENFQEVVGAPTCVSNPAILRSGDQIVGGWTEQNGASDEDYNLAAWATKQLASFTNFAGEYSLVKVKNVKKQVVAGVRYVFTVDVLAAPKEGKKNAQTCTIEVYSRPWENFQQIIGVPTCL